MRQSIGPGGVGVEHNPTPSSFYKNYVLTILLLSAVLNYVDRQIVNILVEPIKRDLHLLDWQVGMMTGLSFAVLYSVMGVPIAVLADRSSRPKVIAASVAVWSAFTLACGFTQNFVQMFLARVGVGCGEGGATPPAHSLIADLTTPQNRSSAMAILSLGIPIGALLGLGAGGFLGEVFGWRMAFVIAALPGLVLAVVMVLTIQEPRNQRPKVHAQTSLKTTLMALRGKRSFWWISAAAAASAFVNNGQGAFYSSFFLLEHGAQLAALGWVIGPLSIVGIGLGLTRCIGGVFGTLAGGRMADRLVKRDPGSYCKVPAYAALIGAPAALLVLVIPGALSSGLMLIAPSVLSAMVVAPTFAAVQTLVRPNMRATAAAVLLFITNMIGLGLGPLAVGALSDVFQTWFPRTTALQYAMIVVSPGLIVSGLCFLMAQRTLGRELEAEA